ncbi:MAG: ABC transporter ATP-binding protein, partial [Crocinitomicaceae bacterium]
KGHFPLIDFTEKQFTMLRHLVAVIVGSAIAFDIQPIAFLVLLISSLPTLIVQFKFGKKWWHVRSENSPEQKRFLDLKRYFSNIFGIVETKLFQTSDKLIGWINTILVNFHLKNKAVQQRKVLLTTAGASIFFAGYLICLYLILVQHLKGRFEVGNLIFTLGVFSSAKFSIYNLFRSISGLYEEHLSVNDILEFLKIRSSAKRKSSLADLESAPEVIFDHVWFRYPSSNKWTIIDTSFKIDKHQLVALTGANGSGKSTILKLLSKIYEPTKGSIYINGTDLRDIDQEQWWSYLGIMIQDYQEYNFLVKDLISLGDTKKETDLDKVRNHARLSTADQFIERWKNTYETQIGVIFDGEELSKGQKQKLALAKVLYREAMFTILDEPTAAIDSDSTLNISGNLSEIRKGKTMIDVSHDNRLIKSCDQILQIEKGVAKVVKN